MMCAKTIYNAKMALIETKLLPSANGLEIHLNGLTTYVNVSKIFH